MLAATSAPTEMSITMGRRRQSFVLDPWLCLSPSGPSFVQRFQKVAALWVTREMWHVLDNSAYYSRRPEALWSADGTRVSGGEYRALFGGSERQGVRGASTRTQNAEAAAIERTLWAWEQLRLANDIAGLRLFWMGDGLSESMLPEGTPPGVHALHERLVPAVHARFQPQSPMASAQCDAVALSLSLGGVPVLSVVEAEDAGPALCAHGLGQAPPCRSVETDDWTTAIEREAVRYDLIGAHCGPCLWSGLKLAVVHVEAPFLSQCGKADAGDGSEDVGLADADFSTPEQLRIYWYRV
jgi:hypothetical protein